MEWDPCETRNYYRETRFVNQVKLQQNMPQRKSSEA